MRRTPAGSADQPKAAQARLTALLRLHSTTFVVHQCMEVGNIDLGDRHTASDAALVCQKAMQDLCFLLTCVDRTPVHARQI
jgi:hypothetical protein